MVTQDSVLAMVMSPPRVGAYIAAAQAVGLMDRVSAEGRKVRVGRWGSHLLLTPRCRDDSSQEGCLQHSWIGRLTTRVQRQAQAQSAAMLVRPRSYHYERFAGMMVKCCSMAVVPSIATASDQSPGTTSYGSLRRYRNF